MERFLIEVPHDSEPVACAKVVETFLRTGSHYLANADWGCLDGRHSAWMIVEAPTKGDARRVVPAVLRADARVVRLNGFTLDRLDELMRRHRRT